MKKVKNKIQKYSSFLLPIFITNLLFFNGCFYEKKPVVKPIFKYKQLPKWYINPPKNDNSYYYSTGQGITKKEAILNALSNFISSIKVEISSNFEKEVNLNNGIYSRNLKYNIKETIDKLEITNYQIIKSEYYNYDKFLVLIKINKEKFVQNLENKLNLKFKNLKIEFQNIIKENNIKKYIKLKSFMNKVNKLNNLISIIKILNSNFDATKYDKFLLNVKKEFYKVKNNLNIEVISNNEIFKDDIMKYLTNNNFKITNKSNFKLYIKVNRKFSNIINNLETFNINVILKNKEKILGINKFKIVVPKNSNLNGYLYEEIKNLNLETFFNF